MIMSWCLAYDNNNEKYWEKGWDETLTLFDKDKKPTSLLLPQSNGVYLGDFLLDEQNRVKHELKKLEWLIKQKLLLK